MDKPLVHRKYYEELLRGYLGSRDIKVVTGVRRCGKSSLLKMLVSEVLESEPDGRNIVYLRLDDFDVPINPTAEWLMEQMSEAVGNADPARTLHVFLDEVQDVDGWEKVVRKLHTRPDTDIYITGSNAYVLSTDLSTLLAGRYVELMVRPLSFAEYVDFWDQRGFEARTADAAFADYLRLGGMPAQFDLIERSRETVARMLRTVYESIILNDVAKRRRIDDVDLLDKVVRYVFSTSGNLFSTNKIVQTLTSMGRKTSQETLDGYIRALEDALILAGCEQTGLAGKQVLRPQRKFYPADTGLRNLMTGFSPRDLGFQLECAVHNELARRGYDVTVGALGSGEVDFVAVREDEKEYVQVTESVANDGVYGRELRPLEAIGDSFPKTVLILDRFRTGITESGVRIANIVDWMLEGE